MHRPFHTMTRGTELTPEEVAAALAEAKARGLPDGWKVSLDVSLDRLGTTTTATTESVVNHVSLFLLTRLFFLVILFF